MTTYDLVVIGSGPAGRRAAVQAAKFGKKVLVVESGRRLGGVSVHTGTIPSKTLRETVLNLSGWRERGFYGQSHRAKEEISASDLMARLHKVLDHEVEVLQHQFLRNRHPARLRGRTFPLAQQTGTDPRQRRDAGNPFCPRRDCGGHQAQQAGECALRRQANSRQ